MDCHFSVYCHSAPLWPAIVRFVQHMDVSVQASEVAGALTQHVLRLNLLRPLDKNIHHHLHQRSIEQPCYPLLLTADGCKNQPRASVTLNHH